jgi:hypothetical protein
MSLLATCFFLATGLAYFLTLKMEAVCSSEMSVQIYWMMWCYIPEVLFKMLKYLRKSIISEKLQCLLHLYVYSNIKMIKAFYNLITGYSTYLFLI